MKAFYQVFLNTCGATTVQWFKISNSKDRNTPSTFSQYLLTLTSHTLQTASKHLTKNWGHIKLYAFFPRKNFTTTADVVFY